MTNRIFMDVPQVLNVADHFDEYSDVQQSKIDKYYAISMDMVGETEGHLQQGIDMSSTYANLKTIDEIRRFEAFSKIYRTTGKNRLIVDKEAAEAALPGKLGAAIAAGAIMGAAVAAAAGAAAGASTGANEEDSNSTNSNTSYNTTGTGEAYAIVGDDSSRLTQEQMNANAEYIYNYLRERGWTKEAICALLGNMTEESRLNPGVWQSLNNLDAGYGLVQFTPGGGAFLSYVSENYGINSVDDLNKLAEENPQLLIDYQLEFISSSEGWYYTGGFSKYFTPLSGSEYADELPENPQMSFNDFTHSTDSPAGLALVFEASYERSADSIEQKDERAAAANEWYEYFKDFD